MSRVLLISLLIFGARWAAALSIVPGPLPPVNWEGAADSRFDPRVERVLLDLFADRSSVSADELWDIWQGWGPDALDYIETLELEDRWQPFIESLRILFFSCPLEDQRARIEARLNALLPDGTDGGDWFQFANGLNTYRRYNQPSALTYVLALVGHPSPNVRRTVLGHLTAYDRSEVYAAVLALADDLEANDWPDSARQVIAAHMWASTEESYARAAELADSVSESMGDEVRQTFERMRAHIRALEPMARVLEQETGR